MSAKKIYLFLITTLLILTASAVFAKNWTSAIAPDFKLQDQNNQWHTLKEYRGNWAVVYFYPKDDTPGCTAEAKNFRDTQKEFKNLKIQVLGISLDSIASHKTFAEANNLNFPILADANKKVSKAYDVLVDFGPIEYAKRQTFIIDPDGVIVKHYATVKADAHASQILKDLPQLMKNYAQ